MYHIFHPLQQLVVLVIFLPGFAALSLRKLQWLLNESTWFSHYPTFAYNFQRCFLESCYYGQPSAAKTWQFQYYRSFSIAKTKLAFLICLKSEANDNKPKHYTDRSPEYWNTRVFSYRPIIFVYELHGWIDYSSMMIFTWTWLKHGG